VLDFVTKGDWGATMPKGRSASGRSPGIVAAALSKLCVGEIGARGFARDNLNLAVHNHRRAARAIAMLNRRVWCSSD
jgi:hypothetical protein